MTMFSLLM